MSSIARRPDGTWRARYRDPAGKEHAHHAAGKIDAQQWLDRELEKVRRGIDLGAGRVTFTGFYAEWSARQVWVSGTVRAMNLAAQLVPFTDLPLQQLRRSHIEAWVKAMTVQGLAPGTIKTRVINVRTVLRAPVRDRIIAEDPSAGVALPRVRRAEVAMTIPTPQQVGTLIDAAEGPWRTFFAVSAFAGLRLGETAALQIGDVDFLRRQLRVRRQVQRAPGGAVEIRLPKYGSERTVSLADDLLTMLSAHIAEHGPTTDPTQWLFGVNDPPHQNTVGHQWRKVCRAAGIGGFTLHAMRHFYASGLIAAGCDVVTVQRSLGHSKATTTLNTYSHLWPTADDRTRAAAAGLMTSALQDHADSVRTSEG